MRLRPDVERVFSALGDPVRRRILRSLTAGERSVGAIVASLRTSAPISQPAVSQHLAVLRDAGLVSVRVDGRRRLHALDPTGTHVAIAWLRGLEDPPSVFVQPLDALATEVARGRRTRREGTSSTG